MNRLCVLLHTAALALLGTASPTLAQPLLLISIDGLRPDDVIKAKDRGISVPNIALLLQNGTHASGVRGVLPTFTLPSHVTLVTGVAPARHGVYNNLTFRPADGGGAPGYALATAIKVPTLWDAAHARGIGTASVNWPVSLGSPSIDANISNYFAAPGTTQDSGSFNRLLSTPGLIDALERSIGPITLVPRHDATEEEQDLRIAEAILKTRKPGFETVHFSAVDEAEHKFGPGSAEAKSALQTIDGYIGRLVATARAVQPDTIVAIVSDHGFTAVTREINLPRAFIDAVLKRKVAALLDRLKADPAIGIEEVYDADELARRGGFPGASFGISYKLDTTGPAARPLTNPLVSPAIQKGTHGHAATHPELYSTFIIEGRGISHGRNLGIIDQRAIAPTLAGVLGVPFSSAEIAAVNVRESKP